MKIIKHATSILTTFLAFYILFSLRDNLGVVLSASLFALQTTILSESRYDDLVKYLENNIIKQNRSKEIENVIKQMKQVKKHSKIKWKVYVMYFLIYTILFKCILILV